MNSPIIFRRQLAARLASLIALACAAATPTLSASCGGGGDQASQATGPYTGKENQCISPPPPDAGGGTGGASGSGGADGGMGGAGGMAASATCPNREEAKPYLQSFGGCGLVSVDGDGVRVGAQCCYDITVQYCIGRPLIEGGRSIVAGTMPGSDAWLDAVSPNLSGLGPDERAALAAAYTKDALLEHASIASFARFSLELLAVGAPASLLASAHEAALDEVRHARACFALASAYAGGPVGPSALPIGGAMAIASDLAQIVERTVEEGCVGETLAAVLAAEQAHGASDEAVRAVLSRIAADEARHAELAWRFLVWAISVGGDPIRTAAQRSLERAMRGVSSPHDEPLAADAERMAAHGRLGPSAMQATWRLGLEEVVAPSARAV